MDRTRTLLLVVAVLGALVASVFGLGRAPRSNAESARSGERTQASSHDENAHRTEAERPGPVAERVALRRAEHGRTFAFERRTEVVQIGPAAPGIDTRTVLEAIREIGPGVSACVEARGGTDALLAALRNPDGTIPRRQALFDLSPDGRPIPSTIHVEPPLAPAFSECFEAGLLELEVDGVGADGARVAVPLMALRRSPESHADGGVDQPR